MSLDIKKTVAVEGFKLKVLKYLNYTAIDLNQSIDKTALLKAISMSVNDTLFSELQTTKTNKRKQHSRSINYFSLEYLMGKMLANNLHNIGIYDIAQQAIFEIGFELSDICEEAHDLALGNGGLGRLAACYLDSLATLNFNAIGYGIHYEHGLFEQHIYNCQQIETPDVWRKFGNPWEVCRPEAVQDISLYGYVEKITTNDGKIKSVWHGGQHINGVPWDIPIIGYRTKTVNILRLWESRASSYFDWEVFNSGDYQGANSAQNHAEAISKVLYPSDESEKGKELRFIQQYFFCACSIKDIVRRYKKIHGDDWSEFTNKVVIQLNDTHPTIAILELMRLLIDEEEFSWKKAWKFCQTIFAYTNHTLLPEALEKWSVQLFKTVLPRHLEIVYQINEKFLNEKVKPLWPDNHHVLEKLSLIEEGDEQMVRMAHICVVTSFKVNGVAEIHSQLVKQDLFPEFDKIWPEKLTNITNGITPRRWLKVCNPLLSDLISSRIDGDWAKSLELLKQLIPWADDAEFQSEFMRVKQQNKIRLTSEIQKLTGVVVNPQAIFDVQIKRLHEYKRQHLNLLHILALYRSLLDNPEQDIHPRVFIFGAKAAPAYHLAKEIIYCINCVAAKINSDALINDKIKVIFMPNYRVSLAEKIIPAADVSEQISTAGKEASGTGNMKLSLNGALTIGTLDGANIEIAEAVGAENIFIFGKTVEQIKQLDKKGYNPEIYYNNNKLLKACLDWLDTDYFTPGEPGRLSTIKSSLLDAGDHYKVLADFDSYVKTQHKVEQAYKDTAKWAKMAILNTANMGKFTSDRSILEYAKNIWSLDEITASDDH
ncbi:MAG: glycogen/starch/alpha-glucan phosphorylase [Gammaproteobacteria bacterium]|nr:glycogen/starch/alpha-glucan phosphorylase [Gammaproteobacteria bacterium]